ncbi:hypothetical protein LTR85_001327 [Meristemomyces frigidus]|nr:hypothetical protein LTR85_001327 [Meristemomyces frigidus]
MDGLNTNADIFPDFIHPPGFNEAVPSPSKGMYTAIQPDRQVELDGDLHPYHPFAAYSSVAQEDLEKDCMDPFRLLGPLFRAASLSWAQVLNFLETNIVRCSHCAVEESVDALEQVRYTVNLLARFQGFMQDDLEAIETRCSLPHSSERPDSDLQQQLARDYGYLLGRVKHLEQRCTAVSSIFGSRISVLESQKTITQAEEVTKLSRLAFVYIPMSFAASLFGMNVDVFRSDPSIGYAILVAFILTATSMCVLFWPARHLMKQRIYRKLRKRR